MPPRIPRGMRCDHDEADFLNVIRANFEGICNFRNDSFWQARERVVCQRRGSAEARSQHCRVFGAKGPRSHRPGAAPAGGLQCSE